MEMGEAEKLLGFIAAILYPFLPFPSPSRLLGVVCSGPLEVCLLASRDFASFPKNCFVRYIGVSDIPRFCDPYYIRITYPYIIAALLGVPFAVVRCLVTPTVRIASFMRRRILIKLFARVVPAMIISLISILAPLKAVSGSTGVVLRKSA